MDSINRVLSFLRVHKFKMMKQFTLLGYSYADGTVTLELVALGSHDNFERVFNLTLPELFLIILNSVGLYSDTNYFVSLRKELRF
ncbi:type II toxin-antitoxin system RelE/ParE family toxin [Marinomonas sp. 2405UD66-6]|uniref:type II toxin-antitoxin system RelE/ParE family toxin n=1 Tax=Marinomonas sp. 2405UD66-6 TaxID=3391834 RepID=UPI0039C9F9DD